MSVLAVSPARRLTTVGDEMRKLPAFLRRDFLVAWSYRLSFVSEWVSLVLQAFMFYFVGLLVDPARLPVFGGTRASYMEFVAVGIALSGFMHLALGRVATGMRSEQMTGTIESLLMTPTATATIQLGTVVYDLLYIPVRTVLFLLFVALGFGLHFDASGLLPAAVVLLVFIPFVWGIGIASAGSILTFRRGGGFASFGVTVLALVSGAYFPLELLPHWVSTLAVVNPVAITVDAMREPLLGGTGWSDVGRRVLVLAPMSAGSLALGIAAFRAALRRERRRGSLGLY